MNRWLSIPAYSEPGQVHAFSDRENQLARVYSYLVNAGNAVHRGQDGVRHKHAVVGHVGVGKSALILQTLGMIFAPLLKRREKAAYRAVQTALRVVSSSLELVQEWYGAKVEDRKTEERQSDRSRGLKGHLEAMAKSRAAAVPDKAALEATVTGAYELINKHGESWHRSSQLERVWRVNTEIVVDSLNRFFMATDRAGLPTVLVFDDLDELTSSSGPSHEQRSRVLSWILGPLGRLRPTCLVLGLRQEYVHEDIRRQYVNTPVPPMEPRAAARMLAAWAGVQQPPLSSEEVQSLQRFGASITAGFADDEPVVIPFHYLQIVIWLAKTDVGDRPIRSLLQRYLEENYYPEAARAIVGIAAAMTEEEAGQCARASPLPADKFALGEREREVLVRDGLIRPAVAGDPNSSAIVIDPIAAYLRMSTSR